MEESITMTINEQKIKENIKALRNEVTTFNEKLNHLMYFLDDLEKDFGGQMLLSIYTEGGKLKIHNFVKGDPFIGESLPFDALVSAIASLIYQKFESKEERKRHLEIVKRHIEVLLETELEKHPVIVFE